MLPSSFRFVRFLLWSAVATCAACSSPDRSRPEATQDDRARGIALTAAADGTSTVVTATISDDRGQPVALGAGEIVVATIDDSEYVLVLSTDEHGDPYYRATAPALLHYADVDFRFGRSGAPLSTLATVRVTEPFTIDDVPSELRVGDELRIDIADTQAMPSGKAMIAFDGACLAPTFPTALQTYGNMTEARFDTTNLAVTGSGCDVTATMLVIDERSIVSGAFDPARSPDARGIQLRKFVVHLDR